jgi:hypothetical protein
LCSLGQLDGLASLGRREHTDSRAGTRRRASGSQRFERVRWRASSQRYRRQPDHTRQSPGQFNPRCLHVCDVSGQFEMQRRVIGSGRLSSSLGKHDRGSTSGHESCGRHDIPAQSFQDLMQADRDVAAGQKVRLLAELSNFLRHR